MPTDAHHFILVRERIPLCRTAFLDRVETLCRVFGAVSTVISEPSPSRVSIMRKRIVLGGTLGLIPQEVLNVYSMIAK